MEKIQNGSTAGRYRIIERWINRYRNEKVINE